MRISHISKWLVNDFCSAFNLHETPSRAKPKIVMRMKIEVFLKFFSNLINYCINKLVGIFETIFPRNVHSLIYNDFWF